MSTKKKVLIVAQLALGDSLILKKRGIKLVEQHIDVTILCNSYNEFIFKDYKKIIEDWPIAFNRNLDFSSIFYRNLKPRFDDILIPSAHFKELLWARLRLDNKKIIIPSGNSFKKMQKNQSKFSQYGLKKINLKSTHWYELYNDFFKSYAALNGFETTYFEESSKINVFEDGIILSPYSRTRKNRAEYKFIPRTFIEDIIRFGDKHNYKIYMIDFNKNEFNKKNNHVHITSKEAYTKIRNNKFTFGFFCDSFMSHLFYKQIKNHYVYITKEDIFHRFAVPNDLIIFDNDQKYFQDFIMENSTQ